MNITGRKARYLTPRVFFRIWYGNPNEDTEPRVQQLFVGSYRETGMGPQGLAGAGFSVSVYPFASYLTAGFLFKNMANIFFITLFISIIALIVGLVKPAIFKRVAKVAPKRKTIALVFTGAIIISFIGIGIFAPPVEKKTDTPAVANNNEQQKTEAVQEATDQTNTEKEVNNQTTQQAETKQPDQPQVPTKTEPPATDLYSVAGIVDGDTIKINYNGKEETFRLIGMDTPETVDPRKPVQCFGKEASNKAKELLSGQKVRIETDPTQGELDKYGRRLAYIYREDGLFYNKYMIEQGYAHEYTYDTPYKYQTEFKAAEKYARENQLGLWSPNTCNGNTASTATPSNQTTIQTTGKYYTSSYATSKYYYLESCDGWKSLSQSYLKAFDSLEDLLAAYPFRILSPQCQ